MGRHFFSFGNVFGCKNGGSTDAFLQCGYLLKHRRPNLDAGLYGLPGANLCFGWQDGKQSDFLSEMVQWTGLPSKGAKSLMDETFKLKKGQVAAVTIGDYDSPDLLLSYLQPEHAMRLVLLWQKMSHNVLNVSLSSVMAVCGNVAVAAYTTQTICFSFCCQKSRRHGHIGRDRMAVGVPTAIIKKIM